MNKHLYDIFAKAWLSDCDAVFVYSDPHFSDLDSYRFRHVIKIPDKKDYYEKVAGEETCEVYEHLLARKLKEADDMQIKRINSFCGKKTCLIILGDVGNIECVKKLKAGYKVLLLGNHDKGATNYKRVINILESHMLMPTIDIVDKMEDNHLFDEVYEGPLMINDKIILSHEPVVVPDYMYNIHGHVHNKDYKGDEHHLNCCAEAIDYTPINLMGVIRKGLLKDIKSIHRETIDKATTKTSKEKKREKR